MLRGSARLWGRVTLSPMPANANISHAIFSFWDDAAVADVVDQPVDTDETAAAVHAHGRNRVFEADPGALDVGAANAAKIFQRHLEKGLEKTFCAVLTRMSMRPCAECLVDKPLPVLFRRRVMLCDAGVTGDARALPLLFVLVG